MADPRNDRQRIVDAAKDALREHGIDIRAPWDCDLDDLERERFDGLCAAVAAVLTFTASHLRHQPSFGDGRWAAQHLNALRPDFQEPRP